jgi:hypothetical protein
MVDDEKPRTTTRRVPAGAMTRLNLPSIFDVNSVPCAPGAILRSNAPQDGQYAKGASIRRD